MEDETKATEAPPTPKQQTNPTPKQQTTGKKDKPSSTKSSKKPSNKQPDKIFKATERQDAVCHNTSTFNQPTYNDPEKELMRQHDLKQAVHAVGGVTKLKNEHNENEPLQYRAILGQRTWQQLIRVTHRHQQCAGHDCRMTLAQWEDYDTMECSLCQFKVTRAKGMADDVMCSWRCWEHDSDICLTCIPVVLDTRETGTPKT
jgi:hypothetical protein